MARLEVDDRNRAVLHQVDAIRRGLEPHWSGGCVEADLPFCLRYEVGPAGSAFGGPADIGRAGANPEGHFETDQFFCRAGCVEFSFDQRAERLLILVSFEPLDRGVDGRAALAGVDIFAHAAQRLEAEDAAGVVGIGVADQSYDAAGREVVEGA